MFHCKKLGKVVGSDVRNGVLSKVGRNLGKGFHRNWTQKYGRGSVKSMFITKAGSKGREKWWSFWGFQAAHSARVGEEKTR